MRWRNVGRPKMQQGGEFGNEVIGNDRPWVNNKPRKVRRGKGAGNQKRLQLERKKTAL